MKFTVGLSCEQGSSYKCPSSPSLRRPQQYQPLMVIPLVHNARGLVIGPQCQQSSVTVCRMYAVHPATQEAGEGQADVGARVPCGAGVGQHMHVA